MSALGIVWYYIKNKMNRKENANINIISEKILYGIIAIALFSVVILGGTKIYSFSMSIYNRIAYGDVPMVRAQSGALWTRLSYTMDEEDIELFTNERTREVYKDIFEEVEKEKTRYPYRPKNLWTWNHIVYSTETNGHIKNKYFRESFQVSAEEIEEIKAMELDTISKELFKKHWDRYIYYTLCMVPQGMVCTVFIQKEAFYGLCYFITFCIYLYAIVASVICIKSKKLNSQAGIYMLSVVVTAMAFIGITNLVYMGIQRYLYYLFGVFYIGLFLVTRELWTGYGCCLWKRIKEDKRG